MTDSKELEAEVIRLRHEAWVWSKACEQACKTSAALRADCVEAVAMLQDAATLDVPSPDFALRWWARRGELAAKYLEQKH